jgi:hypothetical protein
MTDEPTDIPNEVARLEALAQAATERLTQAEQASDAQAAAHDDARQAFGQVQRKTIEARDAFDLDAAARPRFLKAQEAEQAAQADADRAERLAAAALAKTSRARGERLAILGELASVHLSRASVMLALEPVRAALLEAKRALLEASERWEAVRAANREHARAYRAATGDRNAPDDVPAASNVYRALDLTSAAPSLGTGEADFAQAVASTFARRRDDA